MREGWRVRVPASSANIGSGVRRGRGRARHPSRGLRRRRSRARDASGRARVSQRRRARSALRAIALPRRAGPGLLRRRPRRRPARRARAARARPRGPGRDAAGRDRARGPRRQRRRRALRRRRRGRRAPRRARAARARARDRGVDPRRRDRDGERAPPAPRPGQRSTTRCSTSAAPRCSSPRSPPGAVDAMRVATEDRLHQDRRLARARDTHIAIDAMLDAGAFAAWLSGSGPSAAAFVDRDDGARIAAALPAEGPHARARHRRRGSRHHMKLDGKCVVVTGAAGGIGAALARRFAAEGARGVVVADREPTGIETVAREITAVRLGRHRGDLRRDEGVAAAGARRHRRGPLRPDRPVLLERGRHLARRRRGLRRRLAAQPRRERDGPRVRGADPRAR